MKRLVKNKNILVGGILVMCVMWCISCDTDSIYKDEQYKSVIYLLSGTENVYTESYTLNETEPVKYFSIGCGGSNPNEDEVVVTIEDDNVLLDLYNRNNFDIDISSYAKLLPSNRYEVASYVVTIPAKPKEQYVKVPVKVSPLGLSPDSIYFIPLAIKSVSRYEVNENKKNMLFRVTIENDYARQIVTTRYVKKGTITNQFNNEETLMSGDKIVQPLTKNKVRMFAGNFVQNQTTNVDDIERYAIVVQVNDDQTIVITPYGNIDLEMLDIEKGYNIYDPVVMQGTKVHRMFFLNYRYRILNSDGTYGNWMVVRETLTRIEED